MTMYQGPTTRSNNAAPGQVCWMKPLEGEIKINIDGSCLVSHKKVGFGCALREHNGAWIHGIAKLSMLKNGLLVAWNLRY